MIPLRIVAALALLSLLVVETPAAAQEVPPTAHLALLKQTPWVTPKEPRLDVEIRATNTGGAPLGELSLGIALWGAVRSRSEFDTSLGEDPVGALPLAAVTRPQEGELAPGAIRTLAFRLDLSFLSTLGTQSLVYPLRVELRSGDATAAILRTPVIHLVREPEFPLDVAWWWELHEPIRYGPDGRFTSTALEAALGRSGWLAGTIDALRLLAGRRRPTPFDVVVSPLLLTQLQRMRAGYAVAGDDGLRAVDEGEGGAGRAGLALEALRAVVATGTAEVEAYPFAAPLLPALIGGGLARDLPTQLERGREVVGAVLGADPSTTVFRPPGGALDQPALEFLAQRGVGLLLAEATSAERPQHPLGFAPPATARLDATPWGTPTALLPDPGVQARLSPPLLAADPVLGAQVLLGELAAIWLERPGVPRALAFAVPAGVPAAFARPFAFRVSRSPFLRPLGAGDLAARYAPPAEEPAVRLTPTHAFGFTREYAEHLKRTRRLVEDYRSMLVDESSLPDALTSRLLVAEAGQFVGNEFEGRRFIDAVRAGVEAEFSKVRPVTAKVVTLASRTGRIPIRVTNETGEPVRVVVELVSGRIRLADEAVQEVELGGPEQTLTFSVELQTTGRFPVRVVVRTPTGRTVSGATLVVRSTAYNRVALVITLGAALVLLALWGRRFVPRRSS